MCHYKVERYIWVVETFHYKPDGEKELHETKAFFKMEDAKREYDSRTVSGAVYGGYLKVPIF